MRRQALLAAAVLALVAQGLAVPPAGAGPTSSQTAIVALGDSFISGEAGRWQGNSLKWWGNRDGTDRAARCYWWGCDYDAHRVYGSSYDNGCDRSDVAPISSAPISVNAKINLACSGAKAVNIWRASQGGTSFKDEPPQADQLAAVAANYNVKLVVLTISANDLGFSDHVIDCTAAWFAGAPPCWPQEQREMEAALPAARAGLRKAIDEVRAVMSAAGYSVSQYRLLLAGYGSPIPHGRDMRYPESSWDRWELGGCPFWDADADWANDWATPFIVDNMKQVAAEKGVQFLDLQDALDGREVCHRSSRLVDGSSAPSSAIHEWVRWLNSGCCQGDAQESLHPNAFGQRAIGRCIALIYARTSGNYSCRNQPGKDLTQMYLVQI